MHLKSTQKTKPSLNKKDTQSPRQRKQALGQLLSYERFSTKQSSIQL